MMENNLLTTIHSHMIDHQTWMNKRIDSKNLELIQKQFSEKAGYRIGFSANKTLTDQEELIYTVFIEKISTSQSS